MLNFEIFFKRVNFHKTIYKQFRKDLMLCNFNIQTLQIHLQVYQIIKISGGTGCGDLVLILDIKTLQKLKNRRGNPPNF